MSHNEVEVKRSRTAAARGEGPWVWRCWGTVLCPGEASSGHLSQDRALTAACAHIRREHHS